MLALAAALACVLVNAFFVAVEFSLAKVRPTALEALAKAGDASAARALAITRRLEAYLSATQLGITLASLALGWLGEPAVADLLSPFFDMLHIREATAHRVAAGVAFAIISALQIIVGELVPKSLALSRADEIARRTSLVLHGFYLITYPMLWLLNGASRLVVRALRLPAPEHADGRLSLEELRIVIRDRVDDDDRLRRSILERVLRATDRSVRTIMVPRPEMQVLALGDHPNAWMEKVRRLGFSRYPVSRDGAADHIVGYVYVKDLLMSSLRQRRTAIEALRRDILAVDESCTLSELLGQFRSTAIPIAIVKDAHGGTAGLVTLEDVVLELVGDVGGEHAHTRGEIFVDDAGDIIADGSALLASVEIDGLGLDTTPEVSVAAWIVERLGHLATPGDTVDLGGWEAVVEDVRARRVHRVRFHEKRGDAGFPVHPQSLARAHEARRE